MRRLLPLAGLAALAITASRLLVRGALTLDIGVGRTVRPLGPVEFEIAAPPEAVFDVIAAPYLGKTPRAMKEKLEVWERGSDMVLAAHHTTVRGRVTTTLETVQFQRPEQIDFRLVRGPVPHVRETFALRPGEAEATTVLTWSGELGTDFWGVGRRFGDAVAEQWEHAVRTSLAAIGAEAARRAS